MKYKKYYLLIIFIFSTVGISFSQVVVVKGKVQEELSTNPIQKATVKIADKQTITDDKGEFTMNLELSAIKKNGLMITSIGYNTKYVAYSESNFYSIFLIPKTIKLAEVTVTKAETIIEKAIRKIPENYPTKPFMMEGILRIIRTTKDSLNITHFYKNDAALKIYSPSYLSKGKKQEVSLLQNKYIQMKSEASDNDVRFLGGYLVTSSDFVFLHTDFIAQNKLKYFNYKLKGISMINNINVYEIDFSSKKRQDVEGVLFIDTTSFAFVGAKITKYNPDASNIFITIKRQKQETYISYKKISGHWFLDIAQSKSIRKNNTYSGEIYFNTIQIDTVNVKPLLYAEVIQPYTEAIKWNKLGTDSAWETYKTKFNEAENNGVMPKIVIPSIKIDSIGRQKGNFGNSIFKYVFNDNIRYNLVFNKMPFHLYKQQPILAKTISNVAVYNIGINIQVRIYQNLFVEGGNFSNYGLGGIKNKGINYSLLYDFILNKKGRPITISPLFGYAKNTMSIKKNKYYVQNNLIAGINLSYEINHRLNYIAGVKYNHVINDTNNGLLLTTQKVYPTIGIMFKIK